MRAWLEPKPYPHSKHLNLNNFPQLLNRDTIFNSLGHSKKWCSQTSVTTNKVIQREKQYQSNILDCDQNKVRSSFRSFEATQQKKKQATEDKLSWQSLKVDIFGYIGPICIINYVFWSYGFEGLKMNCK